jgi:hypothetical protein
MKGDARTRSEFEKRDVITTLAEHDILPREHHALSIWRDTLLMHVSTISQQHRKQATNRKIQKANFVLDSLGQPLRCFVKPKLIQSYSDTFASESLHEHVARGSRKLLDLKDRLTGCDGSRWWPYTLSQMMIVTNKFLERRAVEMG